MAGLTPFRALVSLVGRGPGIPVPDISIHGTPGDFPPEKGSVLKTVTSVPAPRMSPAGACSCGRVLLEGAAEMDTALVSWGCHNT